MKLRRYNCNHYKCLDIIYNNNSKMLWFELEKGITRTHSNDMSIYTDSTSDFIYL